MTYERIDRNDLADKLVETTSADDPLRMMAEMIAGFVMEAEVTAKVGAEPHERSPERTTHRNGFGERRWDTRLGTLALKTPKVRECGYVASFVAPAAQRAGADQRDPGSGVKGVFTRKIEAALEEPESPAYR